jgi:mono/diheme cytochrome c family protein
MTLGIKAAAVILLAASVVGLSFAQSTTADLYKTKCQMCHGADGKGNTPMGPKIGVRDFHSPVVAKESDQMLFDITKDGKNKMPAYKGKLTDDQIKDLVKYIRSLK